MKKLLSLLFLLPLFLFAQKTIKHKVAAKESYSSIGRLYNVNGRVLANFNNLDYDKGLAIGQVLNIPPTDGATKVIAPKIESPKVTKEIATTKPLDITNPKGNTPIKHTVGKKETLYGLSKQYNVTIEDIKQWNNLSADGLTEGYELIVGYNNAKATIEVPKKVVVVNEEPIVKEVSKKPILVKPVVKDAVIEKPIVKEVQEIETGEAKDFKGGIFKSSYANTGTEEQGTAGVFKSTSGWSDGKYYCLHNAAQAGSIVKITNKANGKFVYAKVLDIMPDLKQNIGLKIRISNAAAEVLGVNSNFDCGVSY